MVKDINLSGGYNGISNLHVFNNELYFNANDASNNYEMWKTDGTEAGTLKVKEINNNGSSNVSNMRVFDNKLLFSALDSNNDRELWVTDGTEAGTQLLYDIYSIICNKK